jgi:hypothetical protein
MFFEFSGQIKKILFDNEEINFYSNKFLKSDKS